VPELRGCAGGSGTEAPGPGHHARPHKRRGRSPIARPAVGHAPSIAGWPSASAREYQRRLIAVIAAPTGAFRKAAHRAPAQAKTVHKYEGVGLPARVSGSTRSAQAWVTATCDEGRSCCPMWATFPAHRTSLIVSPDPPLSATRRVSMCVHIYMPE